MNQTARQSKVLLCIFIAIFVLEIPGGGGWGWREDTLFKLQVSERV